MKWIFKRINLFFLAEYYKRITSCQEAPYQDGMGARLVHEVELECGHKFWMERDMRRPVVAGLSTYLCDSCLMAAWIEKYKTEEKPRRGLKRFMLWGRWMKGVDRRN